MSRNSGTPKPRFRTYSIGGLVKALEKEEFNKPQTVYTFSNGAQKKDTDRTENGFYKR
ncbi:MAG: hypothetical protein OES84_00160 [Kiritimatiellaceae bacterium]|nr:hypothetical protein [Kiritimatiellaceae bacterium]